MLQRPVILQLLVFAVTFLVFARLIPCEFTWWDDQETIHQNPRLNPPTWGTLAYYWTTAGERETMGLYVPVTYTLWSGLAKVARLNHADEQGILLNAAVFHSANVLLHAITATLVFQLLWRLFGNGIAAAIGSLIFSLHPVQVETVGWVSGTKDLLYAAFAVGSVLLYVRAVQIKTDDAGVGSGLAMEILRGVGDVCTGHVIQANRGGGPSDGWGDQRGCAAAIYPQNGGVVNSMVRADDSMRDLDAKGAAPVGIFIGPAVGPALYCCRCCCVLSLQTGLARAAMRRLWPKSPGGVGQPCDLCDLDFARSDRWFADVEI